MKNRLANFELLRVSAIFLIVLLHSTIYLNIKDTHIISNYVALSLLKIISSTGVNLFVILTGYFLLNKADNGIKRTLNLIGIVWFYLVFFAILYSTFYKSLSLREVLYAILPFKYWFINVYLALIILSPYLNKLSSGLTKNEFLNLLLVLFLSNVVFGNYIGLVNGFSIVWFVNLFMIGNFFHRYDIQIKNNKLIKLFLLILCSSFIYNTLKFNGLSIFNRFNDVYFIVSVEGPNNFFSFCLSLTIFMLFSKISLSEIKSKLVLKISIYSLGVYLIHEDPFIRELIWKNDYILKYCIDSIWTPLIIFTYSSIIFLVCVFLESLRHKMFKILKYEMFITYLSNKSIQIFNYGIFTINN